MSPSKFTVINEAFNCIECDERVTPLKTGCRNHCPHCLISVHVDEFPGDRSSPCNGRMNAIGYRPSATKGTLIFFKCQGCGEVRSNRATLDDPQLPDDYDKILSLGTY